MGNLSYNWVGNTDLLFLVYKGDFSYNETDMVQNATKYGATRIMNYKIKFIRLERIQRLQLHSALQIIKCIR